MNSTASPTSNGGIKKKTRWYKYLMPLKRTDMVKFVPMALMMFLILLSQNLIRVVKDSAVAINIGPEAISFIKLYLEMPAGIIFCIIYAKMCNRMSTESVFRWTVGFFIGTFIIFAFAILPYKHLLHPDPDSINQYVQTWPYFRWFIEMYGKWSYVLLYVLGELYPMIVFTLLFWHLANKITSPTEAVRIYPLIGVIGHANLLCCKYAIPFFSKMDYGGIIQQLPNPGDHTSQALILAASLAAVIVFLLHRYIEVKVVQDPRFVPRVVNDPLTLTIMQSVKLIAKSRYLAMISVLTISYSMSVNLIEGVWMFKTKQFYSSTTDFMQYQTNVLFFTGCMTLCVSLVGNFTIRRFGWAVAALCPPIAIGIGGVLFYGSVFFQDYLHIMGLTSGLWFVVMMGGLQNVIGKGVKYSLFDDTKEMAYIPLNKELKTKGKAAVDVLGGKIGKSSGAVVQFLAFSIFPYATYDDVAPYMFAVFLVVCIIWCAAVLALSRQYYALVEH